MRVQIPHNELRPLITEGYDRVYDAMERLLGPEEMIFAKWEAGFGGVIQWTLPNDRQWRCFTQADDYDKQAVINEFIRLKEIGEMKLGTNERLKKAVYSIPSEASVYYSVTPEGKYLVMLTGWGYSFPTQAPITDIEYFGPKGAQDTTARFIEDGNPMGELPVNIHRTGSILRKSLNENGEIYFGKLTPGMMLNIELPTLARTVTLTVMSGQSVYTFDMSQPKAPVTPPPAPHDDPVQEEEVEEVVAGGRDIRVRMLNGEDMSPIRQRQVILTQAGGNTTTETTDDNGYLYFSTLDFPVGAPLEFNVPDVPQQDRYLPAELILDDEADDYELIYERITKSNLWLWILLGVLAAILTFFAIWGACAL